MFVYRDRSFSLCVFLLQGLALRILAADRPFCAVSPCALDVRLHGARRACGDGKEAHVRPATLKWSQGSAHAQDCGQEGGACQGPKGGVKGGGEGGGGGVSAARPGYSRVQWYVIAYKRLMAGLCNGLPLAYGLPYSLK